jgi:AraC family transcriptional regulator
LLFPNPHSDALTAALIRKERDGARGGNLATKLAEGDGWRVIDIVCTASRHDRPFEERHAWSSISLVLGGTFSYRSDHGPLLMSSGAMLLGGSGRSFECSHQYGAGDRCLSFQFSREVFDAIACDVGISREAFEHDRIPPLRALAPLTARAANAIVRPAALEEIGLELAGVVLRLESHARSDVAATQDRIRVAEVLRHLEAHHGEPHTLAELASLADLSRYHFLRTFRFVTGVTPHQWIMRARLRDAAMRLVTSDEPITDIALDVGFDDLSNFIRGFRREFGASPRSYRLLQGRSCK